MKATSQLPGLLSLPLIALPLFMSPSLAIPKVSTVPLGSNDCARWPGYLDFDYTSPVHLVIDSADNTTINGYKTSIVSNRLVVCVPGRESDCSDTAAGFLFPTFRCESGQLHLNIPTDIPRPAGMVTGTDIISVNRDYQNAEAILGEEGLRIAPYHHEIDGVEGTDVYLGTRGRTTWGFKYYDSQGVFYMQLTGGSPDDSDEAPSNGTATEFYGFLKVVPA
ncbi:hypothetical protein V8F20_006836 [Naviculisporaceae sp. PSN 640]